MANSRYRYYDTIWSDEINHKQKGMVTTNIGELFKTDSDILYSIPLKYQYRPDLIANKFFGNPKLFWILVFVNNFANCPEDFETDTVIRIPKYERVLELI